MFEPGYNTQLSTEDLNKLMYTRLSLVDLIRLLWAVFHCFVGVSVGVHVGAGVTLRSVVVRWIGTCVVPLDPWMSWFSIGWFGFVGAVEVGS